ncbi:Las1-domain-containing protein [Gloeophyllum trabeum ATCC 11539]|uniref:Las1-domain-containing protein n=1 Tax=Gloeophyllum trabeum (strain ATCC 11539 / FP-39264 / Madison 617) TaxID=670483 RepID=S7QNC8_GLOTA|nr:Las1-domain-containing protein [Gloeophyllum trabeum ATCC 11539]EPQ61021.1 Las1-domain-containing protein [Gloeophyllum trabeum ATCC 11539]
MRLPRRVPWANIGELDQVCSWIYDDENDADSKQLAVQRLSAWKSMTSLPHALESTLALLTALQHDANGQHAVHGMALRQMYAAAVIRLVNGLVDPLQSGAYARSIASIAQQLGLPAWLVELRHAATHEELPSLELLREAARESMSWLLQNYFLPTLNPSSTPPLQAQPLTPVAPILKQYKRLLKLITRDASLASRHKADVTKVLRDLERWIAEAKVSENIDAVAWGAEQPSSDLSNDNEEPKERWALDRFCDDLLAPGGLVPLGKRKRVFTSNTFDPPASGINIWTPLLNHVQALHPAFYGVAATRIVSLLCPASQEPTTADSASSDITYYICLARWAMWFINNQAGEDRDQASGAGKEDFVATLITNLGLGAEDQTGSKKAAQALLEALCQGDARLEEIRALFLRNVEMAPMGTHWQEKDIDVMNERLGQLLGSARSVSPSPLDHTESADQAMGDQVTPLPRGWREVEQSWKPCPIGVFSTPFG